MVTDSYVEIFTTILGWHFYNVLWDILASTGLVLLPFVGIVIDNWREAFVGDDRGSSAAYGIRAMAMEIFVAMFVLVLAVIPSAGTPIMRSALSYTPRATTVDPTPTTVTGANTGSTYDSTIAMGPSQVNVPVWWYAVLRVSSGINRAVITGLGMNVDGLREIAEQSRLASADDSQLRSMVRRFYAECFTPARSVFQKSEATPAIQNALATYGADDTEWAGSRAFQADGRLYPAMHAASAVTGFALDPVNDADQVGGATPPQWGRPSCLQWWTDGANGVRAKLVAAANSTSKLGPVLEKLVTGVPADRRDDLIAQTMLDRISFSVPSDPALQREDWVRGGMQNAISTVGGGGMYAFTFISMSVVRPSLPYVQALALMGVFMFLAPAMVISRFSLATIMQGALLVFSIKFWSVMWYVVDVLDDKLIRTLYPEAESLTSMLTSFFTRSDFNKALLLNLVIMGMYLMLPAIWTAVMAIAGVRMGSAIANIKSMGIGNAAKAGGMMENMAANGAKRFGGNLKHRTFNAVASAFKRK